MAIGAVTLDLDDYVPSGDRAGRINVTINAPQGQSAATDDAGRVNFSNAFSGNFCIAPGGTHVRTPTASNECWAIASSGTLVQKVLENTPEALQLIANDDGRDYSRAQKRALAEQSDFSNSAITTMRAGFADGAACADGPAPTVDRGTVTSFPPPGYDFGIVNGPAPGFNGTKMTMPSNLNRLQAAGEVLRTFGIGGDYGGFEQGFNQCAYPIFYGTRALNAGAPRQ